MIKMKSLWLHDFSFDNYHVGMCCQVYNYWLFILLVWACIIFCIYVFFNKILKTENRWILMGKRVFLIWNFDRCKCTLGRKFHANNHKLKRRCCMSGQFRWNEWSIVHIYEHSPIVFKTKHDSIYRFPICQII